MSYGPNPWHQNFWDWRAAGNFMCGGAGAGLIAFSQLAGLRGIVGTLLVLAGLGLVGLGLLCVWLEIGRPLRAGNVMFNPRSSWMSREAMVSVLVVALGLGWLAGVQAWAMPLALAALAFVYCQARIIQAVKGIPLWRLPLTVPLLLATGLAEGAGLFWIVGAWLEPMSPLLAALFALLVAARWLAWHAWRKAAAGGSPRALAAIDPAGRALQWVGGAVPLALAALALSGWLPQPWSGAALAAAGICVAATGAAFKFTLVTRAAFNQGFSLARLPVRGVPR